MCEDKMKTGCGEIFELPVFRDFMWFECAVLWVALQLSRGRRTAEGPTINLQALFSCAAHDSF